MPTIRSKIIIKIIASSVIKIQESMVKYKSVLTVADIDRTIPCLNAIFLL
jgi:hypothetical protein